MFHIGLDYPIARQGGPPSFGNRPGEMEPADYQSFLCGNPGAVPEEWLRFLTNTAPGGSRLPFLVGFGWIKKGRGWVQHFCEDDGGWYVVYQLDHFFMSVFPWEDMIALACYEQLDVTMIEPL